jgi:guanylate kinase
VTEKQSSTGLIICISGPSGVGKGTVIREMMRLRPELVHSVSVTTRAPRTGEKEGVDYYFRSKEQFEQMLRNNEILEYDQYCGAYYGTPRKPLETLIESGKDVLMDITVPGSLSVMQHFPNCVTVFLLPPSFSELQRRLRNRKTESEERIQKRLIKAREEVRYADRFFYVVINDTSTIAAQRILSIVEAEHYRYARIAGIEEKILND